MTVAPLTLRERKKARTREAIAQAALALFFERGFDATTVDDIAEAAEISRRTFFRYFQTKEAVFFANQEERLELFREGLAAPILGETPYRTIQRVCLEMARMYMAEKEVALAQHHVIESSRSLKAYDQQLDANWEAAIFDTLSGGAELDLRALVTSGAVIGMIRAVLRDWFIKGAKTDLVEVGEKAFQLVSLEDPSDARQHS